MDEAQWVASTQPEAMLGFLGVQASERRLRLFVVACARRVLPPSPDEDMLEALAVAERFADGAATRGRLARVRSALKTHHQARVARWSPLYTDHIRSVPAWHATGEKIVRAAREGSRCCAWASTRRASAGGSVWMTYPQEEMATQAALLRDIFGNPFRPGSLLASTPTLLALAQAAYDERLLPGGELDPERLAVLADALEDEGCDAAILNHLRQRGSHVRGCWLVDALLGKE